MKAHCKGKNMNCHEVMTKDPICCEALASAAQAAQLMQTHDVGSIPVVENDSNKRLIGIVTDRDLALRVVGESRNADTTQVAEVMTRNPVTCSPDDKLNDALMSMSQYQLRRMPVVDASGQIVGIIAQADVALRTDNEYKTGQLVEEISKP